AQTPAGYRQEGCFVPSDPDARDPRRHRRSAHGNAGHGGRRAPSGRPPGRQHRTRGTGGAGGADGAPAAPPGTPGTPSGFLGTAMRHPAKVAVAAVSVFALLLTGFAWHSVDTLRSSLTTTTGLGLGGGEDGAVDILLVGSDSRTDAKGNPLTEHELE